MKLLFCFVLGSTIAASASAAILVTSQEVLGHCDGFAASTEGFGGYNHGVSSTIIGNYTAADNDGLTFGPASVSSSGSSVLHYSSLTTSNVQFVCNGDYNCFGNGGGNNTTSLGSGHVNIGLTATSDVAYSITVQILDVGSGGFTLYGSNGVNVGFGAGVGIYFFDGTLSSGTYFWDMNGAVNDSTSGVPYQHRARMFITAHFSEVPEPISMISIAIGAGLFGMRRKNSR